MVTESWSTPVAGLRGQEKLREVTRLLTSLREDLQTAALPPHQRDAALEQLKVYGREPQNSDPIFTKEGIDTLARHAFDTTSYITSQNALRCLANAMFLNPTARQIFVDMKYEAKACDRLTRDDRDDEFLVSRIIFLTTYNTNVDIETLIDKFHLAENINGIMIRHASRYEENGTGKELKAEPMEDMALTETLKLIFNISHFCRQRVQSFTPAISHILKILTKRQVVPSKPLEAPFGSLVNSLINLDLESPEAITALFPKTEPNSSAERLFKLLDFSIGSFKEEELDQQVSPLMTLICRVYESAPSEAKVFMKTLVLPADDDRKQPLGQTESFPSRLLRLSTSPTAPNVRDAISSLLFDMSDKNPKTFVKNIGYGFASGFLFRHNIAVPEDALDVESTSGVQASSSPSTNGKSVNPITGQTLDFEPKFHEPEMTQAEKEREAERLMVLFERLKQNGIISAENPVAKAQREGVFENSRFTEVDSDDDE